MNLHKYSMTVPQNIEKITIFFHAQTPFLLTIIVKCNQIIVDSGFYINF